MSASAGSGTIGRMLFFYLLLLVGCPLLGFGVEFFCQLRHGLHPGCHQGTGSETFGEQPPSN
eukprot:10494842-Heterocapsa_arctica.AAC.1